MTKRANGGSEAAYIKTSLTECNLPSKKKATNGKRKKNLTNPRAQGGDAMFGVDLGGDQNQCGGEGGDRAYGKKQGACSNQRLPEQHNIKVLDAADDHKFQGGGGWGKTQWHAKV